MKLILTTALSALMLSAPAFAETAPSPPSSTVRKDGKTDFTKPFIYDGLKQQLPANAPPPPYIELKAGPGARDLTADKSPPPASRQAQP
jgi:hypothetical protein